MKHFIKKVINYIILLDKESELIIFKIIQDKQISEQNISCDYLFEDNYDYVQENNQKGIF